MSKESTAVFAASIACLFNVAVGIGFYYARTLDPFFSPEVGIAIRVLANLPLVLMIRPARPRLDSKDRILWLWGLFGVLTVWPYLLSVMKIGGGAANLLYFGTGVVAVGLAPLVAKQPFNRSHLVCGLGCLCGLLIFGWPQFNRELSQVGLILGVASGFFGALAYLVVARTRQTYAPAQVMSYWTIMNIGVLAVVLPLSHPTWPERPTTWLVLIAGGLAAALAMYLTTVSYQRGSASLIAIISYAGPPLNLIADVVLFHFTFSGVEKLGIAVTLFFSVLAPIAFQPRIRSSISLIFSSNRFSLRARP